MACIRNELNKCNEPINNLNYTPTIWTRADALKIDVDNPTTTMPEIDYNFPVMSNEDVFIWDTMPLKMLDNTVVSVNGWSVILTLTSDRRPEMFINPIDGSWDITKDWEARHDSATIHYWYSRAGKNWTYGGYVMPKGVSPTKAEWAGTPILLDDGTIDLYYTCKDANSVISKVKGNIKTSDSGVELYNFKNVHKLLEADGKYYQTAEQNKDFAFRDPSPFIDPKDGKLYMVFEGNVAGKKGAHVVTDKENGNMPKHLSDAGNSFYQTGCIGLAVAKDLNGDEWELLPPLITAVGVNDQLERPHFVFKDDKYYLFTISHHYTGGDGLNFSDGVYGFVSESLTGKYRPLNSSGLVLGNPSKQPFQSYSHCVMQNLHVTSFIDSVVRDDGLAYRIGGAEAPTIRIEIEGDNTYVIEALDYGYIPPMKNILI